MYMVSVCFFFFSSRRRHTRCSRDWSSDVCSSDLEHRDARKAPDSAAARPRLDDREERVKTLRGERSEERRVGKSVDLGGRRIIKKKKKKKRYVKCRGRKEWQHI